MLVKQNVVSDEGTYRNPPRPSQTFSSLNIMRSHPLHLVELTPCRFLILARRIVPHVIIAWVASSAISFPYAVQVSSIAPYLAFGGRLQSIDVCVFPCLLAPHLIRCSYRGAEYHTSL